MPYESKRNDLSAFNMNGENLGLEIEKLVLNIDNAGEQDCKINTLNRIVDFSLNSNSKKLYETHFKEWKDITKKLDNVEVFDIQTTTKVLLGIGNASVFEFGFNLSKPHGVPYISGSSLKGLVSSYLSKYGGDEWKRSNKTTEKSEYQVQLFGGKSRVSKKDYIGSVNFFDAKIYPNDNDWFVDDIITTHHQRYYGDGNNARLPDGTENPIPVKMIALNTGLKFLVTIQGSLQERDFVKKILLDALQEEGIGGKTAVGYGRFDYMKSIIDQIQESKNEELVRLNKHYGKQPFYSDCFKVALNNNPIDKVVSDVYKTHKPFIYIQWIIKEKPDITLQELMKDKNLTFGLKLLKNPKSDSDAQKVFKLVLEKFKPSSEQIQNNWLLNEIAYTCDDMGITDDNAEQVIENLGNWPQKEELIRWLEKSDLTDKDFWIEMLDE